MKVAILTMLTKHGEKIKSLINQNQYIMSSLNSLYLKLDTLKTIVKTLEAANNPGVEITININDTGNAYGKNISAWISQTKEQREAKKDRYYVGNGNTFWTDGKITVCKKQSKENTDKGLSTDDLPF